MRTGYWRDRQLPPANVGSLDQQLYTTQLMADEPWPELRDTYFGLVRFYNAVGFADLIVLALEAVEENPELSEHLFWIIDEFQDFNQSEAKLLDSLTAKATGVLIAGDDEQALYKELKSSLPEIISGRYHDATFANAMLPYCSRSYYVCLAASAFIGRKRAASAIRKVYRPLIADVDAPKVRLVATNEPGAAVDYIKKFIRDHEADLAEHIAKMEAGKESDPFLLILTYRRPGRTALGQSKPANDPATPGTDGDWR